MSGFGRPAPAPASLLIVLLLMLPAAAFSSTFTIIPAQAYFHGGKKVTTLNVTNGGGSDAVVQLEVMGWRQENGRDVLTKTDEVIAAPPVCTIPAGKSQVVRIALNKNLPKDVEGAYRLVIREVPREAKQGTVGVALRITLPVFIDPSEPNRDIRWSIGNADGNAVLRVQNSGNVHAQVGHIRIISAGPSRKMVYDRVLPEYILPRESKSWALDIPADSPLLREPLMLMADTVDGREETFILSNNR